MSGWNLKPSKYTGARTALEGALCNQICRLMIASSKVSVDLGQKVERLTKTDFVLASPDLFSLIRILVAPTFWVGESYARGAWYLKKGQLPDFLDIIRREAPPTFGRYYEFLSGLRGTRHYISQYLRNLHYTRRVRKHYEVDSKIYEMILDPEMVYTCAFFERTGQSLEEAQQHKLATAIERLDLRRGKIRILDIGCGWGATTRAIVRHHPLAEVCGLSISNAQIDWARTRDACTLLPAQAARIEYRREDYVDHKRMQTYDAVVVMGMIEHVGLGGYDTFFERLYSFLKPGGAGLIHTIVAPTSGRPTNDWIDERIFTGGYAPSVSELVRAIEQQRFKVTALHLHGPNNYRRTIEAWLSNFTSNAAAIADYLRSEGESEDTVEQFVRTWLFYLSSVRNMFSENDSRSYQVVHACIRKM